MNGGEGDRVYGGAGRDHFSPLDARRPRSRPRRQFEPLDVPTPDGRGYLTFAFRGTVTSVPYPDRFRWRRRVDRLAPARHPVPRHVHLQPHRPGHGHGTHLRRLHHRTNGPVAVEIGDFRCAAGPSSPSSSPTTVPPATSTRRATGSRAWRW